MTGKEIKDYLEASYNRWIVTATKPTDHVLNIVQKDDPRTGQMGWSFIERAYNFDSAAGIDYTGLFQNREHIRSFLQSGISFVYDLFQEIFHSKLFCFS